METIIFNDSNITRFLNFTELLEKRNNILENVDLSGQDLGSREEYENITIKDSNLKCCRFASGIMKNSNFKNVDFTGFVSTFWNVCNSKFENCTFSGSSIRSIIAKNCKFVDCKFVGVFFEGGTLHESEITNCYLRNCSFERTVFIETICNSIFIDVIFSFCNFENSDWSKSFSKELIEMANCNLDNSLWNSKCKNHIAAISLNILGNSTNLHLIKNLLYLKREVYDICIHEVSEIYLRNPEFAKETLYTLEKIKENKEIFSKFGEDFDKAINRFKDVVVNLNIDPK